MSWQDRVAKSINKNLNDPPMPDGFAEAKVSVRGRESVLAIRVGDRTLLLGPVGQDFGTEEVEDEAREWIVTRQKAKAGGKREPASD